MNTQELLMVVLGGGFTAALVSGIFQIIILKANRRAANEDKRDNKDAHITKALGIILHDRIKYLGKRHIKNGYIESEDLRDLIEMHMCYHTDLERNGFLDTLMQQVKELPIKDE